MARAALAFTLEYGIVPGMLITDVINAAWPLALLTFGGLLGLLFIREWKTSREQDFRLREEELYLRRKDYDKSNNIVVNNENSASESDLGGYVTIDIPEERKSMFHDLLKGFEEYAALKGYKVTISIDTSIEGKISFKIVVSDFGITATRNSVISDLDEYIEKIKSGEPIAYMPGIINSVEHSRLIMALNNRIAFLQQN
jgi:hypothetical protein